LDDLSILYPIIADPPLFDGAVQDRLICDDEDVVAERFVGDCGAVRVFMLSSASAWAKLIIIKTAQSAKIFPNK
jgi:hypothetical protein